MAMRLTLAVALVSAASGPARADEQAVVVVNAAASPHARAIVAKTFRTVLEDAGWALPATLSDGDLVRIATCAEQAQPWACIAPIVQATAIDRVVVVAVAQDASPSDLVLTASLVVADGGEVARSRDACPSCTDALLAKTARGLARSTVDHAARFAHTTLAVSVAPAGATVTVDDRPIGPAPIALVTSAGAHRVVVDKPGFVRQAREVELAAGKRTALDIALVADDGAGRPTWPLAVAGAGLAAAAIGTVISLRVDAPPPTEPQPKYLYSGPGLGLAIGGAVVAAAGLGLYLWLRPAATSGPTIAASARGGSVGWVTAF